MQPTETTQYLVDPLDGLIISILVLFLGMYLNRRIRFLGENYIPPAVTGGLICSGIVAVIMWTTGIEISFDMEIRDVLLLVFFSTVGLSAKFSTLKEGGKALAVLVAIAAVFLLLQNATGVGIAVLFGVHPGYGLLGGSVSFAGGHGTAIAWGAEAEAAGLVGAGEVGIAFATFGLIAGGLIGGPVAKQLITRYKLEGPAAAGAGAAEAEKLEKAPALFDILIGILVLAICVGLGDVVNRFLFEKDVLLPGFLTSMFVGIVMTNLADLFKLKIHGEQMGRASDVSLNIFLSMSLMSMQLWALADALGPITAALIIQMLVITLFVVFVVFRFMGRDYDAAVMSAGFVGLGLGATPVAIANMDVVTRRFGASPKAFLVVPLVGAFFIDMLNAAVIKFYIGVISNWVA